MINKFCCLQSRFDRINITMPILHTFFVLHQLIQNVFFEMLILASRTGKITQGPYQASIVLGRWHSMHFWPKSLAQDSFVWLVQNPIHELFFINIAFVSRYSHANASWCLNSISYSVLAPMGGNLSALHNSNWIKQSAWSCFLRDWCSFLGFDCFLEALFQILLACLHVVLVNLCLVTSSDISWKWDL